jgi:hypothetical protein
MNINHNKRNMISNNDKKIDPDFKGAVQTVLGDYGRFLKKKTEENNELVRKNQELTFEHEKEIKKISNKEQLTGLAMGIFAGATLSVIVSIFTDSISIKLTIASLVGFFVFMISLREKD